MDRIGNKNLEMLALQTGQDFSKIPPQAREFEEAVIGTILTEENSINKIVTRLKPNHFYVDAHRLIYTAMYSLFVQDQHIELITVVEELKKMGNLEAVGGSYALMQMANNTASTAGLEYKATIIIQKWVLRALIAESSITIREAYEDSCDPLVLMGQTSERIIEIQQSITTSGKKSHKDEVNKLFEEMMVRKDQPEDERKILGLKTGVWKLDQRIYGLCKGHLIIVAGNSSEGKSTLMVQALVENAEAGIPVGCFSLEMPYGDLLKKMLALKSGVNLEKIMQSNMDETEWSRVHKAFDVIMQYKIYIDDTPDQDILDVVAISKMWKMKYDIEFLCFDYLQLARAPLNNKRIQTREQEVAFISGKLKALAKDLDIPVMALSQLSRKNDSRVEKAKRPVLSDLRDSGSIEQDANVVIFVFRPEKHGITQYPSGFSTHNITEIIVAKCRMGKLGTIYSKFLGATGQFDNSHSEIKYSIEGGEAPEEKKDQKKDENKIYQKKLGDDDMPF